VKLFGSSRFSFLVSPPVRSEQSRLCTLVFLCSVWFHHQFLLFEDFCCRRKVLLPPFHFSVVRFGAGQTSSCFLLLFLVFACVSTPVRSPRSTRPHQCSRFSSHSEQMAPARIPVRFGPLVRMRLHILWSMSHSVLKDSRSGVSPPAHAQGLRPVRSGIHFCFKFLFLRRLFYSVRARFCRPWFRLSISLLQGVASI
jgi:hypothetical protein